MYQKFSYHLGLMIIAYSLSPLTVGTITRLFGANFIEPFILIGLVLVFWTDFSLKKIFVRELHNSKFLASLFALIIFAIIGILTGDSIGYVYSDFRAIIAFAFFSLLNPINPDEHKRFIYFVKNLFIYISIYETIVLLFGDIDKIRFITLCACPFFIAITFLKDGKYIKSILFVAIMCLEATMSAMRINYLFLILYILYLLYIIFVQKSRHLRKIAFLCLFIFLVVNLIPVIASYLQADESRYLHTVIRFERLFEENSNEESVREDSNILILNESEKLIIPQGLGWQNHVENIQLKFRRNYEVLSSMDSNFLYCTYHFGLIIGGGLIIFIIIHLFNVKKMMKSSMDTSDKILNVFIRICIVTLFVLKSWIFVYFSFGFIYGIFMFYTSSHYYNKKLADIHYN